MPDTSEGKVTEMSPGLIARASQAVKAGRMSKAEEKKIDAKADRVLGR